MKDFIKKLLSGNNEISSKRFISLYGLIIFTVVVGFNICGYKIQPEIIYVITGMILGSSAMTLIK